MAVTRKRLTDAGIARLKPSTREYTVWDTHQTRLGVRVRPTGSRSFVYLCREACGSRRITIGSATLTNVAEARRKCRALEAEDDPKRTGGSAVPTFAAFVEGPGRACLERCKPSTRQALRIMLNGRLLPAFGSARLDRITRAAVNEWFDGYSRSAPAGANRALEFLRRLLNHAVACNLISTNPAQGIGLNSRPKLTRFLSREEINRLHGALDHSGSSRQSVTQQADIIRLLLLTGCRKSEIVTLLWKDIGENAIRLSDSKTGPRAVPLNAPARAILERQAKGASEFVFPSPRDRSRPRSVDLRLWCSVRRQAGIEDVRLHDLRHTYASHAVLSGVPLPVVSRLLGHRQPSMTLRYAHVGDRDTKAAAERIGSAVAGLLDEPVDVGEREDDESANG